MSIDINITSLKGCLAAGYPYVVGIDVYESLESQTTMQTGIIQMPDTDAEQLLGGHAIAIVGYDDAKQWFILRNSWGTTVGDQGYFYMPFAMFSKSYQGSPVCDDFWVILTEDYLNNPVPTPTPPKPTPVPPIVDVATALSMAKTAYKQTSIAKARPYIKLVETNLGG